MDATDRGSDALLEQWRKGPGISDELVQGIVEATRGLDIQDVLVKGQPAPDFFRVSAASDDIERCGTVVRDLMALVNKGGGIPWPVIRVFPRGIPWPEQFILDVTVGDGPARRM